MRYRSLSESGDYAFGGGPGEFLINSPAAVAQAVKTRLGLAQGEWFLDTRDGTPYSTQILGENTLPLYDIAIKDRIAGTEGVLSIDEYASYLDDERNLRVECIISTIYGQATIQSTL